MFGLFGKKKNKNKAARPAEDVLASAETQIKEQIKTSGTASHPTDFASLVEKATHHTQALQAAHKETWGLGKSDRFEVDLEAGIIRFIFEGDKIATAPVTLIGTWAGNSQDYLWGWDHPMSPPADNAAAKAVKAYADVHNITELQSRKVDCTGDEAWQYVGIACLLGDLQGVYRAPNGGSLVYLGFGSIDIKSIV